MRDLRSWSGFDNIRGVCAETEEEAVNVYTSPHTHESYNPCRVPATEHYRYAPESPELDLSGEFTQVRDIRWYNPGNIQQEWARAGVAPIAHADEARIRLTEAEFEARMRNWEEMMRDIPDIFERVLGTRHPINPDVKEDRVLVNDQ